MQEQLQRIRNLITVVVALTFGANLVMGLGAATAFQLTAWPEIQAVMAHGFLPGLLVALFFWGVVHFRHFLDPVLEHVQHRPNDEHTGQQLHRRLVRFTWEYWGFLWCYALIMPAVFLQSRANLSLVNIDLLAMVNFMAVQLALSILLGLPAYLLVFGRFSRITSALGVHRIQNSLRWRYVLTGSLVPLLGYSLMTQYFWVHMEALTVTTVLSLLTLGLVTLAVTWLSVGSLSQSLQPVEQVLARSGATTHEDLARLRPQSTDEIGYLTQTLARVFSRLNDQESHMHAVVDHAAEGIIVADENGMIETFNRAAEQLFGYPAHDIRSKHVSWLFPSLQLGHEPSASARHLELEGRNRNGCIMQMSVNISAMSLSGKRMYTYLVHDISEQKAAQERQHRAEARYRDLVETAHDLVWSMDSQLRWTYLNRAAVQIYGYEPLEMLHRPVGEFQSPETAEQELAELHKCLNGTELYQFETVHIDREGRPHHLSLNAKARTDEHGKIVKITGTARDITAQKAVEKQLTFQAEHDALTGLYNRRYFQRELERVVARVARGGSSCALLYIDLDQFKYVNDTLGHAAGDRLLVEITRMLADHVREGELLARFGGDEFTLLLYNVEAEHLAQAAEHFRCLFENYRFVDSERSFNVSCSIGVALIDQQTGSADEALARADLACNLAKSRGRNRVSLYDPSEHEQDGMAEDMGWAARVRDILDNDRFLLVYQPIVSLSDGEVHSYEVLLRMPCDDGEVILPGGFMPAAERFGLIHSIDRWMVRHAIRQLATLHKSKPWIRFSINLSPRAFDDPALIPLIGEMVNRTGIRPDALSFEVSEKGATGNLTKATEFIRQIKQIGCGFALDDFGAGFCSFALLKDLPVDHLKIDSSLVRNIHQSASDQVLVKAISDIARTLGKTTVAENVEHAQTFALLQEMGVDYAQGHYLGRPLDHVSAPSPVVTLLNQSPSAH